MMDFILVTLLGIGIMILGTFCGMLLMILVERVIGPKMCEACRSLIIKDKED